ncbi:hypothetical protein D9611_002039 [Ephemerocybe angulata]|uniref:DUF7918 domain-containing protein n=1 Tax=Ephemerocybe angulata TaxID=980116 RepID=A0A8H5CHY8_9AGAR|nr:hypothetical protein D9611_002039 [Tulosesus angulatus]
MPELADISIWVEMEGVRLQEYGIERDETTNTVTCWIPCQAGKEFRFGAYALGRSRRANYTLRFVLDGQNVNVSGKKVFLGSSKGGSGRERYYEGVKKDRHLRRLQFAKLTTTEDHSLQTGIIGLGELVVEVHTFKDRISCEIAPRSTAPSGSRTLVDCVLHEQTKTGMVTDCVQLGEPIELPKTKSKAKAAKADHSYTDIKSLGKVIFKYRNIDVLYAQATAPKPGEPAAASTPANPKMPSPASVDAAPPAPENPRIKQEDNGIADDGETDSELRELEIRAAALEELCNVKARIAELKSKKRKRDPLDKEDTKPNTQRVKKETEPVVIDLI